MPDRQARSSSAKLHDELKASDQTLHPASDNDATSEKVKAHIRKAILSLTAKEKKARF